MGCISNPVLHGGKGRQGHPSTWLNLEFMIVSLPDTCHAVHFWVCSWVINPNIIMSSNNDFSLSTAVLVAAWVEWVAGSIFMYARFHTNAFVIHQFRSDFWWALSAYVEWLLLSWWYLEALTVGQISATLATIFLTISVHWGFGHHVDSLTTLQIARNQFWYWLFITFALIGISLGKIAITAFILHIEGISLKLWKRRFLYFVTTSGFLVNLAIIPVIWTQCIPVEAIWDISVHGNCSGRRSNQLFAYFQGSMQNLLLLIISCLIAKKLI